MGHDHIEDVLSTSKEARRTLTIVFILTFLFMFVEIIVGILSNSLALLADAGHMFGDVLSLGLSVFALTLALRPRDQKYTFGYNRAEVLAAFINGLSLIIISSIIVVEAIERFNDPQPITASSMLIAAFLGLLVNIYGLSTLHKHNDDNLNVSSASLHILADLLGSIAAIFAGIMILLTNQFIWDIIVSIFITILILISGSKILLKAARILMQRVPTHVNTDMIENEIRELTNVENIHDLHIWAIDQKKTLLTAHVEVSEGLCQHDRQEVMLLINSTLKEKYAIHHSTLQIEHSDPKLPRVKCGC